MSFADPVNKVRNKLVSFAITTGDKSRSELFDENVFLAVY